MRGLATLSVLEDDDWESAFSAAAGKPRGSCSWGHGPDAAPGSKASTLPFDRDDVIGIIGIAAGENDGADWIVCGQLNDGRWFFLAAGCDYTGWDCQSGGRSYVASSPAELGLVMTAEERERMTRGRCLVHDDCLAHGEIGIACRSSETATVEETKR